MKRLFIASTAAFALLLAGETGAWAGPMSPSQVQWTYNFSPGAPALTADNNPGAGVTFTNEATHFATGSSDVVATNLRVFSSATAGSPDSITGSNGNYSLTLQLSEAENGNVNTATLTFTGKLAGSFSSESSNLTNTYGPNASQTVSLGSFNFTVSLLPATLPGPPDQTNAGSIAAHVTVSSLTPQSVPEPSTMLLSGLGLTFLGAASWRKRRAKARLAVA
jgi:uncharacterized iron-regulated membrane protein